MRRTDNIGLWLVLIIIYTGAGFLISLLPGIRRFPLLLVGLNALLILSTFRLVRYWIRKTLIRLFNPQYFDSNERIKEVMGSLQITQPHHQIIDQVLRELEEIFQARIIAVALLEDSRFTIVNCHAPEPITLDNVTIEEDATVIRLLQEKGRIVKVGKDTLQYNRTAREQPDYRFREYKLFQYAIPLMVNEDLVGIILTSNIQQDFIRDWENGLLQRFTEYLGMVLQSSKLYNKIRWEALQKNTLIEISKQITSTLDVREILELVMDSLNQVVNYSAAGIFLVKQNGNLVYEMVTRGYEQERLDEIKLKVGQGVVGTCIREQRPIIVGDVSQAPQYLDLRISTRSEMCVPIYDYQRDEILGAFNIESDTLNAFSGNDLERLSAFSEQVSIAIQNARLYREVVESRRFERDMEVAKEIQNAFLPKRLPENPEYDFAAICQPSQYVGGDFYDVYQFSNGKIGIAIGDVSGKGIPGAILMANLYAGYRSRVRSQDPISSMLRRLNDLLVETTNSEKYTTFFYGELDPESGEFTYSNAGHNPPMIIHPNGEHEELTAGGPVIGALEGSDYQEQTVRLQKNDMLLLYTDGITEARNTEGQYYEVGRLLEIARKRKNGTTAQDMMDMINRDVYDFTRGESLQDDVTVVLVLARSFHPDSTGLQAETS